MKYLFIAICTSLLFGCVAKEKPTFHPNQYVYVVEFDPEYTIEGIAIIRKTHSGEREIYVEGLTKTDCEIQNTLQQTKPCYTETKENTAQVKTSKAF